MQINYTKTGLSVSTANPLGITVNVWNLSDKAVANFTADTNSGDVVFNATGLKSGANYSIKKDGNIFATVKADMAGKITFNNSAW